MHTIKDIVKQLIGKSLDAYNTNYTKVVNTRIDNIVAQAGNDNTEIVDARIDSAGVTHTTLNNRILAETKMNDEQLVEYTGSSLSVDDTMPGYLQNIEIKGNTIQNEDNLEDIRSVGDKVEGQELYEIPVLSCGKNVCSGEKLYPKSISLTTGELIDGFHNVVDLYEVQPNTTYTTSINGVARATNVFYYDKDKKFLNKDALVLATFTTPSNAKYVRHYYGSSEEDLIQTEVGTQATPYEPYVEDKLTILSPVQLEKVGDVADRIIEKDGVWGVEKNVKTYRLPSVDSLANNQSQGNTNLFTLLTLPNAMFTGTSGNIMCTHYKEDINNWSSDVVGCKLYSNLNFNIRVLKTEIPDIQSMRDFLLKNNVSVKYPTTKPQFIPLPHSQQVKLRTFANKTNISFLTEIEGTIKAQVPKSLGATVNTHTEQISNLNKELDRVKKLEESTVSTVTTESDFTTVEATSNGYFEDVKLEGKTLVNLWGSKSSDFKFSGQTSFNPTTQCIEYTSTENRFSNCFTKNTTQYKPNTKYTLIVNVLENTFTSTSQILKVSSGSGGGADLGVSGDTRNIIGGFIGVQIFTITTLSDLSNSNIAIRTYVDNFDSEVGAKLKFQMIILEGDHTQNPPNEYIEGLKSVGDGTDEIVVSSVNENLFDLTGEFDMLPSDTNKATYTSSNNSITIKSFDWVGYYGHIIPVKKGKLYYSFDITYHALVVIIDSNGNELKELVNNNQTNVATLKGSLDISENSYIKIQYRYRTADNLEGTVSNVCISQKAQEYIPHQSDKKRLLFYNNETQTWEKPILREWDSIEKHSDGKYYYHQRSGEVVLNGSEEWGEFPKPFENTIAFQLHMPLVKHTTDVGIVADKIQGVSHLKVNNEDVEGISLWDSQSFIRFRINKSKLSTQDVQGFKQWLQANNVTVVYQLAEEKVYECTNIDLITYANETNYIVESGVLSPKTTLKVHNNISNVVSLLQNKVSLLESNITNYMITQNRMQLASTYSADSVTFKVDYALCSEEVEYNEDLYNLILNNILVGKDNYNYDKMFTMILDYASWNQISWEQFDILVGLMDIQHNPPIEEIPTDDEIVEEIPNEIM